MYKERAEAKLTWIMPSRRQRCIYRNDFVQPNEQSQTCLSFAMARNRTFKNNFVKPNEQSSSSLEYSSMARTFVQASAEPNLFGLCRAQPKVSKENRTFKNQKYGIMIKNILRY
ncbi:MAG: hypothetical protein ACI3YD_05725, partial [Alloprevotella sp.]